MTSVLRLRILGAGRDVMSEIDMHDMHVDFFSSTMIVCNLSNVDLK